MRRILAALILIIPSFAWTSTILFPEIDIYSGIMTNYSLTTSYRLETIFDTGSKYGFSLGLGFLGYNITSFSSNLVTLSSLRIYSRPLNLFEFGYFFGKNRTLGLADDAYQGFEHHTRANFEYIGYKDISGMGFEIYEPLWDNLFEPHIFVYSQNPIIATNVTNTNSINVDTVLYLNTDQYSLELYAGINAKPDSTTNFDFSFYRHFGLMFKTAYGKMNFVLSIYLPDDYTNTGMSGLFALPNPEDFYFDLSEHIISGLFEQTLTFFKRPSFYNQFEENWRGDLDVYLMAGLKFEKIGIGFENTLTTLNYFQDIDDKVGGYAYFSMNSLKYKFGAYYAIHALGTPIYPLWSAFVSISGNL